MTPIEQQALALINEVRAERGDPHIPSCDRRWNGNIEIVCRLVERAETERQAHEAFRQEVSEAVEGALGVVKPYGATAYSNAEYLLSRFVIPKPVDPLVEVLRDAFADTGIEDIGGYHQIERNFRKALAAHNLEITEKKP